MTKIPRGNSTSSQLVKEEVDLNPRYRVMTIGSGNDQWEASLDCDGGSGGCEDPRAGNVDRDRKANIAGGRGKMNSESRIRDGPREAGLSTSTSIISVSPSPMRHIADDCLSALVHRDVLDPDGLIASAPVSFERLYLRRERPGELVESAFRAVLLRDIFHIGEPTRGS